MSGVRRQGDYLSQNMQRLLEQDGRSRTQKLSVAIPKSVHPKE